MSECAWEKFRKVGSWQRKERHKPRQGQISMVTSDNSTPRADRTLAGSDESHEGKMGGPFVFGSGG